MKYNLTKMFEIQVDLNKKIKTTQNLTSDDTRIKSHLCILVELMELCNETRCFNYWSKKTRGSDDAVLEEFADVLCFLLTDIIDEPINEIELDDSIKAEDNLKLTRRFLELSFLYTKLNIYDYMTYYEFLRKFLELGFALGYNWSQIYNSYIKKVEKNHKIQESFKNKVKIYR